MIRVSILLLTCASTMAQAEVFKCTDQSGKTVYQSKPCQKAAKEQQLDIKSDPVQEAEAKAKLEALRSEQDAKKALQLQADKEAAEQKNQTEQLEALKRSAAAQQEQAAAQQRQAEALEKQNQQINRPLMMWPAPRFLGGTEAQRRQLDALEHRGRNRRPVPMQPLSPEKTDKQ